MTLLAFLAVSVVIGTWFGIRWAEESNRLDGVVGTVMSTPLPDPTACAACGAAVTGARAGIPPLGAGSPSDPRRPHSHQPVQRAPGHK